MNSEVEFIHKAMHSYNNIQCNTLDEFNEDLNKITSVKKMLTRYQLTGDITPRLILNHIVILFNVFGNTAYELMLYKIPREQYHCLFPFLLFLNRLPIENLNGVELDQKIIEELRKI